MNPSHFGVSSTDSGCMFGLTTAPGKQVFEIIQKSIFSVFVDIIILNIGVLSSNKRLNFYFFTKIFSLLSFMLRRDCVEKRA